jgi:serine/threonine-protein kinase HipA
MAVDGDRNTQYLWTHMLRRHWLQTARLCGLASRAEEQIEDLIARTPDVVREVASRLPKDFPIAVSGPVLEGLAASARKLAAG